MADADFLAYVGAVGGVIGTISGIAGAVVAYVSYRKTEQLKILDLRIELGKLVVGLLEDVDDMSRLLQQAKKSRKAVGAATGMRGSGAAELWDGQWEADEKSVASLHESVAELNADHAIATTRELEEALIAAHSLHKTATRIRQSYEQSLAQDDKQRDSLRQAVHDRLSKS